MAENQIRVLLDTNVFVAAYWAPRSASARLIGACIEGRVQAYYSQPVKREVMRMLGQIRVRESYTQSLEPFWEAAVEVQGVAVDSIQIDDPDDRKFLEAAMGGEVDFLATNDVHLLRVRYVGRTEILKPASLMRTLGD